MIGKSAETIRVLCPFVTGNGFRTEVEKAQGQHILHLQQSLEIPVLAGYARSL